MTGKHMCVYKPFDLLGMKTVFFFIFMWQAFNNLLKGLKYSNFTFLLLSQVFVRVYLHPTRQL